MRDEPKLLFRKSERTSLEGKEEGMAIGGNRGVNSEIMRIVGFPVGWNISVFARSLGKGCG